MTVRQLLKCRVCGATTLFRTQMGWLERHPIRFACGQCNIIHNGELILEPEEGGGAFNFDSADVIPGEESDFYIEVSGELLTEKLKKRGELGEGGEMISPFFKSLRGMGMDQYKDFKRRTTLFLSYLKAFRVDVTNANQLWRGGNVDYLKVIIEKHLSPSPPKLEDRGDWVGAISRINIYYLAPLIDEVKFAQIRETVMSEVSAIFKANPTGFEDLLEYFQPSFEGYFNKLQLVSDRISNVFNYLIPVFGLRFHTDPDKIALDKGITTASFEDIKEFYIDCFEDGSEILPLLVACNNLKHRGNFQTMKNLRRNVNSIPDFQNLSKGNRIQYVDNSEVFDLLAHESFNSRLRNAIGHSSYDVNPSSQLITYFPKGRNHPDVKEYIYLTNFGRECWKLFQAHVALHYLVVVLWKYSLSEKKGDMK